MKAGEIWRVPINARESCLVRVLLRIDDLGLEPDRAIAFARSSVLAQVSRPGVESFDCDSLLVNGVLVTFKPREASQLGFQLVGEKPGELGEVEFPWWLIQGAQRTVLFCRGEIETPVVVGNPAETFRRWDVRLSPKFPAQLVDCLDRFARVPRQDAAPNGRILGIPGSDIRYHPNRSAIMRDLGLDVADRFSEGLAKGAPDRLPVYLRALSIPPDSHRRPRLRRATDSS